jgi:hypothetical protein
MTRRPRAGQSGARKTGLCPAPRSVRRARVLARVAEDGADSRRGAYPRPERRAGSAVAIPLEIVPELRWHLERFAEPGDSGYVFVGPKGGRPRRNNFRVVWAKACQDACISGVHFHDLRHTGNTLAAATGASLRELMERMGRSSPRAALIYQHASKDHDEAIAKAVGRCSRPSGSSEPGGRSHAAGTEAPRRVMTMRYAAKRYGPDLRFLIGAGDGNRTRMTSLEVCRLRSDHTAHLALQGSASDRETPLITVVNGTLMDGDQARAADGPWG